MLLFIFGTLALLIFLAVGTWRTALFLRKYMPPENLLLLPAENVFRISLIVICIFLARISGQSAAQFGWQIQAVGSSMVMGLGVGVGVAISVPHLTRWAVARFGKPVYSTLVLQSIMPRNRAEWFWVPLALVPAVLLEELLFRSLLLGGFANFAPPILLAVVWSIIFGAMHVAQGTLGVVVATVLGLLLSALFLMTQNVLTPIVAHYVINLIQLVWASQDRYWESLVEGSHS